jgi:hypothetical protein
MKTLLMQFVSAMTAIQRTLMKVICNMKNMMIQEFQLERESKLIQLSIAKMHQIRFVSMMMVIRMISMKMICNQKNMTNQEL